MVVFLEFWHHFLPLQQISLPGLSFPCSCELLTKKLTNLPFRDSSCDRCHLIYRSIIILSSMTMVKKKSNPSVSDILWLPELEIYEVEDESFQQGDL